MASIDLSLRSPRPDHLHTGLGRSWPLRASALRQLLVAYAGLSAVFVGLGWLVVHRLGGSALVRNDARVEDWFVAHRTGAWNSASWWGSELAETATKVVVTAVVCIALVVVLRRWYEALLVAVPLVLEAAVFLTVTLVVDRPRPSVPHLDGSPLGSSFPSGHTAAAACYAGLVVAALVHARRRRLLVGLVGFGLVAVVTVVVGTARMYRGMHNLSDVVAGAVLGAASVLVGTAIVRRAARAQAVEPAAAAAGAVAPTAADTGGSERRA